MTNHKKEHVIYFKDLLFVMLRNWKRLIIVGLILGVVLGGYSFMSDWSQINDQEILENNKKQNQLEVERYEAEKAALNQQIVMLNESIHKQQVYLNNSLCMRLDPYDFYEVTLSIYVETDYKILPGMEYQNPDKTKAVAEAYRSLLLGEESLSAIAQAIGTEPRYLLDVFTVTGDEEEEELTDTLTLSVKCPTQQEAKTTQTMLLAQLETVHTKIEQTVEPHTYRVIDNNIRQRLDKELEETQTKETVYLNTLFTSLATARTQLLSLTKPTEQITTLPEVIKHVIKMACIGAILGVLLVSLMAWIAHIVGGKVYSARTLENRTGVKTIGRLSAVLPKSKITRWLMRLEGRDCTNAQVRMELIAADVGIRCKDIRTLLVAGSVDPQLRAALEDVLRKRLDGVRLVGVADVLDSVDALEALRDCDGVLLVEQCEVSRYATIAQQAEVIEDYGKKLLGCVLYGG